MRVLLVITKSELGGAQTHVWQLAEHLHGAGHEAHVCAFPGGWLHDRLAGAGIPFHPIAALSNSLNPARGIAASRAIDALIGKIRPDVVHCHSSAAALWTRLAVRNRVPTLYTAHGWGFTPGTPPLRRIAMLATERLAARFTSAFICVSEFDRNLAIEQRIASPEKFITIHNGVETTLTVAARPDQDPFRIVFVGRLSAQKDPGLLLRAFLELPTRVRDCCQLQIIGEGPLLSGLRQLVPRGMRNVLIPGAIPREEVLRILVGSQVFVLTSRYEGFPIAILEAMSIGLAVIASDVGGVREAVTPECGILIGRGDREGLKRALCSLIEDRPAVERYGSQARLRAQNEFSVTTMCERTLTLYDQVRKTGR